MSFGALSSNAILALNKGAGIGNFCHNTGEGSVSRYHLEHGGDLIWQVGIGYLGCRDSEGRFCPTTFVGMATQDPTLSAGLVVGNKAQRIARFHDETVNATMELAASAGLEQPSQLNRSHIFRRVSQMEIKRYDEIYPYPVAGCLLTNEFPSHFAQEMAESSADCFMPKRNFAEHTGGIEALG